MKLQPRPPIARLRPPRSSVVGHVAPSKARVEAAPPRSNETMADGAAESTKELTEEGAKVTTVAEGTDATAAPPAEPANPLAEPIFVSVVHTFVDDEKKAAWWEKMGPLMGDKEQMAAMAASWKALGYVGHYSMPCGPEGNKMNCLWECQTEDAASKFQARRPRRKLLFIRTPSTRDTCSMA